ncbi:MAG: hypothetical protein IT428_15275 [Planctomycetaceae bacterium]|nr:hypothetical protein [Planctomycetaceae bacterium]
MNVQHSESSVGEARILVAGVVLTVIAFSVQTLLMLLTTTQAAPLSILSLTSAGRPENARPMWDSWSQDQKVLVGFGLGIDYVGMIFYGATFHLLGKRLTRTSSGRGMPSPRVAKLCQWLPWWAVAFDTLENIALLALVAGKLTFGLCVAASRLSVGKWSCLVAWALSLGVANVRRTLPDFRKVSP